MIFCGYDPIPIPSDIGKKQFLFYEKIQYNGEHRAGISENFAIPME